MVPEYGESNLVPLKVNDMQRELLEEGDTRNIILKARKEGFTTIILAMAIINCFQYDNYHAVFIADCDDNTVGIFEKAKDLVENCKHALGFECDKRQIKCPNGSWIKIATAGRKRAFQGADVHFIHFSEIGSYEHPDIYASTIEAAPKTAMIFLESTANGRNLFYTLWNKAITGYHLGEFAFKPFFFGWNRHPRNINELPKDFVKTEEEIELVEEYGLTDEQISWRRWKPTAMPEPEKFPQEHPLFPGEAFLSSGRPVFSGTQLTKMRGCAANYRLGDLELDRRGKVSFTDNKNGIWKVFHMPEKARDYIISADLAEGKSGGDYSVASVWDPQTGIQMAQYRSKCDLDLFSLELRAGGYFYNTALLIPERNFAHDMISSLWNEYAYPRLYQELKEGDNMVSENTENLGFRTTLKNRPTIVNIGKKLIRMGQVKINDLDCIEECMAFEYGTTGKPSAPPGQHDDTVMAMLIAFYVMEKFPEVKQNHFQESQTNYYTLIGRKNPENRVNKGRGGY